MLIQENSKNFTNENQIIAVEGKFWRANRLYKLVVQNEKIYGIWIGGQFNYLNNEQTLSYFSIFLFFVVIFLNNILFSNFDNFIFSRNSFLGSVVLTTPFIILLVLSQYLVDYLINRFFVPTGFWQNIIAKARNKSKERFQKSVELTSENGEKDEEFVKQNNKNFIFKKSEITQIEINTEYNVEMYPETHFGQIIITKNAENKTQKRKFLPKENSNSQEIVDIFAANGFENLVVKYP